MKFIKNLIYILSCLGIVFPVNVFGIQVEIQKNMNLRRNYSDGEGGLILKKEFLLRKGTVLEIDMKPDQIIYKPGSSKEIDFNATLNKWLTINDIKKARYDSKGKILVENFFPVTIISSPDGKHKDKPVGLVALNVLALQDGLRLKTIEDTDFLKLESKQSTNMIKSLTEKINIQQTDAGTCIGDCSKDSGPITQLKEDLKVVFQGVEYQKDRFKKKQQDQFSGMKRNFGKTCFGLPFDQFIDYLKKKTAAKSVPAELVLGKIAMESDGQCLAYGKEKDGTVSTGLLQVTSRYSGGLGPCSNEQYQLLEGMSLSQMETGKTADSKDINCIQNPALNLKRGLELFVEQYRLTNGTRLPTLKRWSDYTEEEADAFRFAQAGYNGGQVAINRAGKSVEEAAKEFGISLDKDDWETRRLFFFRKILKNNTEQIDGNGRHLNNAIGNISYTEAILGRRSGNIRIPGFIDEWENILFPANKN